MESDRKICYTVIRATLHNSDKITNGLNQEQETIYKFLVHW